MTEAHRCK